jgi:hypothetical protein
MEVYFHENWMKYEIGVWLNFKKKTKENIFTILGCGQIFIKRKQKALILKKNDKLDLIKLKLCSWLKTINRKTKEKIFIIYVSNKGLQSQMYKGNIQ